jgi:hypothetical protein
MIIDKSMLVDPYRPIFIGPPTDCNGSILESSGIIQERKVLSNGAILMDYKFLDDGHVYHYVSNKNSNEMPDLFLREFQEIDSSSLKRHPINETTGSHLFSRKFTLNIGALDSDSLSWSDAPEVCKNSFKYIQDIVRGFIPQADFNEMLSAVYIEGQKMSLHDGSKEGAVGSVIAALSLGSPAEMRFRRKPRKNESKLSNEAEPTDINDIPENTGLETKRCEYEANKKKKLMNGESSSQNNQDKFNANRNNCSKRGKKKVSKKAESSTSKVEQISESMMNVQLSPKVSERVESDTSKAEQSVENITDFQLLPLRNHPNQFSSLPIDISRICIRKRMSGPVLLLDLHHGDLVVMKGKVLQDNYD